MKRWLKPLLLIALVFVLSMSFSSCAPKQKCAAYNEVPAHQLD
ncbi:MAG: hypothetical protein P8N19_00090 [Flavobacteriales bacterium]|nr:hypothetical protein [Flavobacteriales bacterium]MDG1766482.1 hypothetical protein [Flavobacteriales bacterium]